VGTGVTRPASLERHSAACPRPVAGCAWPGMPPTWCRLPARFATGAAASGWCCPSDGTPPHAPPAGRAAAPPERKCGEICESFGFGNPNDLEWFMRIGDARGGYAEHKTTENGPRTVDKSQTFRGVRVHVSTGYNPVEGNRRASRNGRVSDLPPETPHRHDSPLYRRCTLCSRLYDSRLIFLQAPRSSSSRSGGGA
jgi:hypothetical protein